MTRAQISAEAARRRRAAEIRCVTHHLSREEYTARLREIETWAAIEDMRATIDHGDGRVRRWAERL